MKTATIFHLLLGLYIIFSLVFYPGLTLHPAQAQPQNSEYQEPSAKYSREELAQMLAPIALYPDTILTQVLMASTYPIEVIEADRWRKKNPELKEQALDNALITQDWDPSVKAICHFPSILALMSDHISETTDIGNAFLAQEGEVMDMIQELRSRARQQGNLTTNDQQQVLVQNQTIIIQPVNPRVIYVPYYDPFSIYGPWWYPTYPPYYWGPPGVRLGVGISFWPGFYFGFAFGNWSYFDWHRHSINIHVHKRPRYVSHDRWLRKPGPWRHIPHHRRGVAYRDKSTARRYGQQPRPLRQFNPDTRGFPAAPAPGRGRIEPDRHRDDRVRSERNRQERQRIESEPQIRRQAPPAARQQQQQIEREQQQRRRAEQEKQIRDRTERERQQRARTVIERAVQEQQPRQQAERGQAVQRQRVPKQSRDNIFNRIDNGSRERQSSERGRFSRQQSRSSHPKGQSQWDEEYGAGGRQDRGRNDRGGDGRNRFRR